jgi:hypothetical protein
MASYVKSIQRFSVTLGVGTSSVSTALAGGTVVANCVPFISKKVTTAPTTNDDFRELAVDAYFSGSDVVVATTNSASRALTVNIEVVEFDGTYVAVEAVAFTLADLDLAETFSYTSFTNYATKAFIYHTWRCNGTLFTWGSQNVSARLSSATLFEIERGSNSAGCGAIDGHVYIVKDTGAQNTFSTQYRQVVIAAGSTTQNSTALTSIDDTKTFLIGGHLSGAGTDDNLDSTVDAKLAFVDPNYVITVSRVGTTNSCTWRGSAVQFAGSAELVQRGTLVQTTVDGDENQTFPTAVNTSYQDSLVKFAGNPGGHSAGAFEGTDDANVPESMCALSFVINNTTINIQHLATASDNATISWEVVRFDVTPPAAAGRRIFVIT